MRSVFIFTYILFYFPVHHSPSLQRHPNDLYQGGINVIGTYIGNYQGGSAGSESPGSPMTPLTPITPLTPTTPTHLQSQFCHQSS